MTVQPATPDAGAGDHNGPIAGQPTAGQPIPGLPTAGQPTPGLPTPGQPTAGQPPLGQYSSGQPATGHADVDAALAEVADSPPAEQVRPLSETHRVLREKLDTIGDV